ncbi:conserved hypothetical protein [Thiocapsa sp. KS1]|nr:DUF2934 domain-containing protein [Thiocapsa sp. KS1]CRI67631.1 conserved hypothetical protein [Thiocapsa sp. KS1]
MADDKTIVTKKTAPKPAADTKATVATQAATKKTVAKPAAAGQNAGAKVPAAKTSPVKPAPIAAKAAPAKKATPAARPAAVTKPSAKAPAATGRSKKAAVASQPGHSVTPPAASALEGKSISLRSLANVSAEDRLHMIHEAAYYRAEKRRFAPGHEVEDWAEAEREIDALLANAKRISGG